MQLSAFTDILGDDFELALDALAGIGLTMVDLRARIGADTVDTLQGAERDRRLKQIAARGLTVGCVASWGVNAMKGDYEVADPAHRKRMRARTEHLAKLAHAAGTKNVRVYSFKRPAGRPITEQDRADNAAFLSELAGICAEYGRVLVIENEPPNLTATCAELGDLMKRAGSAHLKINWDIVNSWNAGELPWQAGVFDSIAGHVAHVHVKGAKSAAGAPDKFGTMALPGVDDVPHLYLLERLAETGFDGIITIDPHYHDFAAADRLAGPFAGLPAAAATLEPERQAVLEVVRRTQVYLQTLIREIEMKQRAPRPAARCVALRPGEIPVEQYGAAQICWLLNRKTAGAAELTMGRTVLPPGEGNPVHLHPNCEEALYVLGGEIEHYIRGAAQERVRLKAGEAILIPRGMVHNATNVGKGSAELLVSFSSADRMTILEKR